jgi:hypothetical protein
MEDLICILSSRTYQKSSRTDRFYVAQGGRSYVQFMNEQEERNLNLEIIHVQLKQEVRDQA